MNNNNISYDRIANLWCEVRESLPVNKCIVDFASKIKPNGKVLDIGCGSGYPIDSYLSKCGFIVTGIDFSVKMLEKAKAHNIPKASFICCDFFDYKPKEKFDAIIAFDSFFHFPKERQEDIYRIVSNWLNDGGYLLFTHGKNEGEINGEMFGENFYYSALNIQAVSALLSESSFAIEALFKDYKEPTGGERDLLIIARKTVNTSVK